MRGGVYLILTLPNSATAYPAHDEVLEIRPASKENYTLRGYAYGGGGRRIQRVEISLDKGNSRVSISCLLCSGY